MNNEILSYAVKQELNRALEIEKAKIHKVNHLVGSLTIQKLGERPCNVNAPVATDGGDSKISFTPLNIEVIRVTDSKNENHILEFIPLSSDPKIFSDLFEKIDVLREFLKILNIKYEDVSHFLPQFENGKYVEKDKSWDNSKYADVLREVLEWSVLLKLARQRNKTHPNLILRDGLLRSVMIKDETMKKLGQAFENAYNENGTLIVGVAKRSRVLNYISMSITMDNPFATEEACCCKVPPELEKTSYSFARPWMYNHSFGELYLAKLTTGKDGIILPIDIPNFLQSRDKEILEYLVGCSKATFPTPGYPYPLIKAHEYASIKIFEKEVWYSQLVDYYKASLKDETEKERFTRFINLYKNIGIEGVGHIAEAFQKKNRNI